MTNIEKISARIQAEQERENRIREIQDRLMDERQDEIRREAQQRDEQRQQHYAGRSYDNISDLLDDRAQEIIEATRSRLQQIREQRELDDYRREIDRQRQETEKARPEREMNEYATQLVKIEERQDDRGNVSYTASRGDEQVTGRTVQEAAQNLDAAEQERRMYPLTAEERRAEEDRRTAEYRAAQDAKTPPTPEVIAQREQHDAALARMRENQDRRNAPPEIDRDDRGH